MSIKTRLIGAELNEQSIDLDGASLNIVKPLPPFVGSTGRQRMRVFRQHLTDDGLPTDGTNQDMRVDGSSTNVDFYIQADSDKDLYITRLAFIIADLNATLQDFGALSALTNGCQLEYTDDQGTVTINDAITTNFELYRVCGNEPQVFSNVVGSHEAVLPDMDIVKVFRFQWGILLAAGTLQRITFRVRDNLSSGITQMDCVAYGFTREVD